MLVSRDLEGPLLRRVIFGSASITLSAKLALANCSLLRKMIATAFRVTVHEVRDGGIGKRERESRKLYM